MALTLVINLVDMMALASTLPVIRLIVDPDIDRYGERFLAVYELIGAPSREMLIWSLSACSVGLLSLASVGNWVLFLVTRRFGMRCQNRLSRHLMSRVIEGPFAWLSTQNPSTLTRLIVSDCLTWNNEGLQQLLTFFAQGSLILFAAITLVLTAPTVGLVGITVIAIVSITTTLAIRSRYNREARNRRAYDAQIQSAAYEMIAGIKDIRLSGKGGYFVDRFIDRFFGYGLAMIKLRLLQMFPQLSMLWFGQVGLIAIALAMWASGISSGQLASQMALVVLITSRVIPAATRMSNAVAALWNVSPHLEGIFELMKVVSGERFASTYNPPGETESTGSSVDLENWKTIRFENVQFAYEGGQNVLDGVTLKFERGKSYGLVGPSGAGKSTLIDLLLGLLEPNNGRILIDDVELKGDTLSSWQARIGYVAQEPFLTDGTVGSNIAFGLGSHALDNSRVETAVNRVGLSDLINTMPQGLDSRLGDRGSMISGGQRQRIAIARALYSEPDVLIFDEATSSLDNLSERQILDTIQVLQRELTTVSIAHRLNTIRHCDCIYVLENGRVTGRGDYRALTESHSTFRHLEAAARSNEAT